MRDCQVTNTVMHDLSSLVWCTAAHVSLNMYFGAVLMALAGFSQATIFRRSDVDLVPFDPFVFLKGTRIYQDSLVESLLGVLLSRKPYLAGGPAFAIDILTSFARYPFAG